MNFEEINSLKGALMNTYACCFLVTMLGYAIAFQPAQAQDMKLGELKEKNAQLLSKDELNALLPESTYSRPFGRQTHTYWKNESDGRLVGGLKCPSARMHCNKFYKGTWQVRDDGAYCVEVVAQAADDTFKWCRFVWKVGSEFYGVTAGKPDDSRTGFKFALDK